MNEHPAVGLVLGYARVSTTKQHLDRQLDALNAHGIPDRLVYVDKRSGKNVDRDGLNNLLAYARPGDVIVCHTLDRLGRNLREVLVLIHELRERGVHVKTLADPIPIDTSDDSAMGAIAVALLALFAEMERAWTNERTLTARSAARSRGRQVGRPRAHGDAAVEYMRLLHAQGDLSLAEIGRRTGIPKTSVIRYLAETSSA